MHKLEEKKKEMAKKIKGVKKVKNTYSGDEYHQFLDPEANVRYGMMRDQGMSKRKSVKHLKENDYNI